MNRYQVIVAYDGFNYRGWQAQPHRNSIQVVIEKALTTLYHQPIKIVSSGRTDTGVHAYGQVFHYDADLNISPLRLKAGLNSLLPLDIRIQAVILVNNEFHARYGAKSKTYEYKVNVGAYNLFERKYTYQLNRPLDLLLIKEVLQCFVGTHDFTSFNTTTLKERKQQVRTISEFSVRQVAELLIFTITGDSFLRYMIRMLIGTVIQVGLGKLTITEVEAMLAAKEKGVCRYKAPASGLYLREVTY